LYDALLAMRPSPVVALNRAVALAKLEGAEAGLAALNLIETDALKNARPFHAAKADMLARGGRTAEARAAYEAALALEPPRAERLFLEQQLGKLG
jgi:RNA polymerase sigma-70 factor (ECF subfamily)